MTRGATRDDARDDGATPRARARDKLCGHLEPS